MNNKTPKALTDPEWSIVSDAIPGLNSLSDQTSLRSALQMIETEAGESLPPDGMYIVIDGSVNLQLHGEKISAAGKSHYFFEEHLLFDDLAIEFSAVSGSKGRVAHLSRHSWRELPEDIKTLYQGMLFGDLVNIHLHDFQQPINCCNITAAALSLTALGYSCDVNDIFKTCALPVAYVVDEGMTMGELYDVASSYIFAAGLRDEVGVELYYFDKAISAKQDLYNAIEESKLEGKDKDILVANFDVGIAHGKKNLRGGHFSLIAKFNKSIGLVHMIDVHPEKYGKIWVTSIDRLYDAMTDHDGSSKRSRGLMRFIIKKDVEVRLDALANSDCYPVNCTQYIDLTPEKRRHIFSRSSTNMNSLHVLSMGMGIMDNHPVDVDDILIAARLSYTDALSFETTARQLTDIANEYLTRIEYSDVKATFQAFDESNNESKDGWFKTQLLGVAGNPKACLMINIDYNGVLGYEAIHDTANQYRETPMLKEYWCIIVDYFYETDVVILADMSPATSQVWRAPRQRIMSGMHENAAVHLEKTDPEENESGFNYIISHHKLVLFYNDEDPWSYMLKSVLGNIGATELYSVDVSGFDLHAMGMRKKLTMHSGKEKTPYLYFKGTCLGEVDDIMSMVRDGELQKMLQYEGLPVLMRKETPSLDNNMFSYPKGGLTEPRDGKHNILLCSCGSSAADKIPDIVERLIDAGHNVKLIPTPSSENFFKDIGIERILNKLRPSDIYRDDDEWNFRYTEFGMPVRAAHLALCDWADCVIVSPVTCNTMGKIAHGVADNLLSSVFVAWQYQRKPVILCPACNTNMWNNITTQNNVSLLKRLGAHIQGPRSGILSNGRMGTGMMATVDEIMEALDHAFEGLDDHARTIMRWGRAAAAADDPLEWHRIYRAIDEDVVGINILDDENGDSLLHYAAGGEGDVNESGIERGIADIEPMQELIKRGINVNLRNDYHFSPMHVAMMSGSLEAVKILLEAGAEISHSLGFMKEVELPVEITDCLTEWAEKNGIEPATNSIGEAYSDFSNSEGELYFTYGSLKRGFPNYEAHIDVLGDFVGKGKTRQSFPLVVPREPSCSNPNCPYLHRMAALVEVRGKGHRVNGEIYRVKHEDLETLDRLEGFAGPRMSENVFVRKKITVLLDNQFCEAFTYFIADSDTHLESLQNDTAEMVTDYTIDMAEGELKPGFVES